MTNTPPISARGPARLSFAGGGWVIALSIVLSLVVIAWALIGVLRGHRPTGDGRTLESYGFDLSNLNTRGGALVASGNPRDFLEALDAPKTMAGFEMLAYNSEHRSKYVVSDDRVIGIVVNAESRAYPIRLMNVHEVVNDTLGGVPIAVTFSPLCDTAVAFDRRMPEGEVRFGVSGLVLDSNLVLYDRSETPSLWSQLGEVAIAGPAASRGTRLVALPNVQVCTWKHWLESHPATDVILPKPGDERRIKNTSYSRYLLSSSLNFPVARWHEPGDMAAKTPVILLRRGTDEKEILLAEACQGMSPFPLGDTIVEVDARAAPASVLFRSQDGTPLLTRSGLHFAMVAFDPITAK